MTQNTAIEKLFKAHYAQMHRLAVALVHDDDIARDIVHDVFMLLVDTPPARLPGAAYLLRAVRNRCLNYIRDCDIHRRAANRLFIENEEYDTEDWPDEETLSCIQSLIATAISPQARMVIELRFGQGLPFAEVARNMGISESAVYRHLSHALSIIRKKLNENG